MLLLKRIVCLAFFVVGPLQGKGALEKYGPFELILYSKYLKCDHNKSLDLDVRDIGVHFYDFQNDVEVTYPIGDAVDSIFAQIIDIEKRWIIYVPGFNSPFTGESSIRMEEAMRNVHDDYYVAIDHFVYTTIDENAKRSYEKSVKYAYDISKAIAKLISQLFYKGINLKTVRLIGHSLGAQMAGYIGFMFTDITGQRLPRITALDPAGVCFYSAFIEDQVRSGAAEYVEVYHCNAGGYGTKSVLGDADFFVNGGQFQEHCHVPLVPGVHDSAKAARCSHMRCIQLYADTVYHKDWFVAKRCDTYEDFKRGICNEETLAGFWSPGTARGVYYLSTKEFDI